jgi:putative ABC transport system substrate-binding protein
VNGSGNGRWNGRSGWQALLLLGLSSVCALGQPRGKVLVVATSAAGPYGAALAGLRAGLERGGQAMTVIDLSAAAPGAPVEWIHANRPDLIVAVGSKATRAVASAGPRVPVISTMVLGTEGQSSGAVEVLGLEPAPERWIERLSALFPRMRRLGLLAGKATPVSTLDATESSAKRMGYTVRRAQCADVSEALTAISNMAGRVDLVWFAPDSTLFNDATVKPLLLAALQRQVPVIGFSEAFVRSGAAVGLFADYEDIGLRAAEVAQRVLSGGAVASFEAPRVVNVAVNERVMRILGLRSQMADPKAVEALAIR